MNWFAKLMSKGHLDSSCKDWCEGIVIINQESNSPQTPAIYPILNSVDYRSILLNTKNQFMTLRSDTFGTGIKKKNLEIIKIYNDENEINNIATGSTHFSRL